MGTITTLFTHKHQHNFNKKITLAEKRDPEYVGTAILQIQQLFVITQAAKWGHVQETLKASFVLESPL